MTRTHSERSRDSSSLSQSEEKRVNVGRVASPELQTNKSQLNENFYLPPVQRIVQDEKKSKNVHKDEPKSQKSQKGNYDRLITQEEQKRLKVRVSLPIQVFASVEMITKGVDILVFIGGRGRRLFNVVSFRLVRGISYDKHLLAPQESATNCTILPFSGSEHYGMHFHHNRNFCRRYSILFFQEIFETRQQTSKLKRDQKPSRR